MASILNNTDTSRVKHPSAISTDWLSIYCIGEIKDTTRYKFILQDYSTRQFRKVHEIYFNGFPLGVCTSEPTSKIINSRAVIVKFENNILYSRSAKYFINSFLIETKLNYKSITRADICRDFTDFNGGISPAKFIQDFFAMKYLKNGRSRFTTIGTPANKLTFDYLRFGSRASGKTIYLYNKSKELREQKDKQWIHDFWKLNGLWTGADVWRLEFSFKGSSNKVIDPDTSELNPIHWNHLFTADKLYELVNISNSIYFDFRQNNGTKNKSEMEKINLFSDQPTHKKLIKLPDNPDDTKHIRSILRALMKEYEENSITNQSDQYTLSTTIDQLASKYNLTDFLYTHLKFTPCTENLINSFLS